MRVKTGIVFASLAMAGALVVSFNGCGNSAVSPIAHVVVIFQENRTTDNLFHDSVLMARGADIASTGVDSYGRIIPLAQIPLATTFDLDHRHQSFENMYNQGKMNGANLIPAYCGHPTCSLPNIQFSYVNPADVQPYFDMAEQYAFGDRMFQTNQGPSFPAHQFIISGTSAPTANSPLFAAENPLDTGDTGCTAPANQTIAYTEPSGKEVGWVYPCFEHPALTDLLDASQISWRYYTPLAGSIWTGPNAIRHLCQPQNVNGKLVCTSTDWTNNVILSKTQVLTDIANRQLPGVSWVIPTGLSSDHAAYTDGSGPSWVAAVVNAIGNSPYWSDTAIIITWDDWGGWYDHVPPPQVLKNCTDWGCGYIYGFRVPLIVVSPYAKRSYISHSQHDFGSILHFIEDNFGLGTLGYADAKADNLSDCFDYSQHPTAFRTIAAPMDAAHFLNDTRPPTPPDND